MPTAVSTTRRWTHRKQLEATTYFGPRLCCFVALLQGSIQLCLPMGNSLCRSKSSDALNSWSSDRSPPKWLMSLLYQLLIAWILALLITINQTAEAGNQMATTHLLLALDSTKLKCASPMSQPGISLTLTALSPLLLWWHAATQFLWVRSVLYIEASPVCQDLSLCPGSSEVGPFITWPFLPIFQ